MSGSDLRPANAADLPALAALDAAAFGASAWGEASLRAELSREGGQFFVMQSAEGAPLGLAIGWASAGTSEVLHVAVDPAARRQGLGRRLLQALLTASAAAGADESWLEVEADNAAAIALYRAEGYADRYRRADYYGPGRHALMMSRAL